MAGPSALPEGADRFEVRATADSHFGWIRTRLSLERTLMSWMRTGTALIGFLSSILTTCDKFQALNPPTCRARRDIWGCR